MKEVVKKIYRISGLRYFFHRFGLEKNLKAIAGFIENLSNIFKIPASFDEKNRGIYFYLLSQDITFQDKKINLKKNLDTESIKEIDRFLDRYKEIAISGFIPTFSKTEKKQQTKVEREINSIKRKYPLSKPHWEACVFVYDCGLRTLSAVVQQKIFNYILGKDIIDAGAFIGDSALMFSKNYKPRNIFAFEPTQENYDYLLETIKINHLDNVSPIKSGLGDKNEKQASMIFLGSSSHLVTSQNNDLDFPISVTSIDEFVLVEQLNVGIIKMDIEGYESKAVQGSIDTIRKYRPVMLLSIYHNPDDFFGIKPFIESLDVGYKFYIRKINPEHPVYETMLICVPEELI